MCMCTSIDNSPLTCSLSVSFAHFSLVAGRTAQAIMVTVYWINSRNFFGCMEGGREGGREEGRKDKCWAKRKR